jgi:hypothetical protein
MENEKYNALAYICAHQGVPEYLKGKEKKNIRNNLLKQRNLYRVEDGKLYYRKTLNVCYCYVNYKHL